MAGGIPRVCMDTCCVIDLLKDDLSVPVAPGRSDNIWHYRKLLEASRRGDIQVMCSGFVLAECAYIRDENDNRLLNDEVKKKIEWLLWSGESGLIPALNTWHTYEITRDLVWNHDAKPKGADRVHIAKAVELNAKEFLTTDDRIGEENRAAIQSAYGLSIIPGKDTELIPQDLRQGEVIYE